MSEPVHVILNPAASGGAGARLAPTVEEHLAHRQIAHQLMTTAGPGHATELAQSAMREGAERILIVGGDGTIHEVVNGLLSTGGPRPDLAVLPLGTGNDFYRMVGAPRTMREALSMLEVGVPKVFDVGVARWEGGSRFFVNLFGVGIDVDVLERRKRFQRLSGLVQYLAALVAAVISFRPIRVHIVLDDGEVIDDLTMLAAVTVGPSAGGGFLLSPGATPDDGFLDLCFVDRLNYFQVALYIPRVIRGTHANLKVVRLRRMKSARIEARGGRPFPFELDGEVMPTPVDWVEVAVDPARISILVPEERSRRSGFA